MFIFIVFTRRFFYFLVFIYWRFFESSPRGGVAREPRRPLEVLGGLEVPGILHDSPRKLSREFWAGVEEMGTQGDFGSFRGGYGGG